MIHQILLRQRLLGERNRGGFVEVVAAGRQDIDCPVERFVHQISDGAINLAGSLLAETPAFQARDLISGQKRLYFAFLRKSGRCQDNPTWISTELSSFGLMTPGWQPSMVKSGGLSSGEGLRI